MCTKARVLLIPVLVIIFYLPITSSRLICAVIFAIAGFTDLLDGYLARKWSQTTSLGAFLDPVADKLIVATALVLLVQANPSPWLAIPAAIIIGREITVSALREWMAELGARSVVAVSKIGKLKTTLQMLAIFLLLLKRRILYISMFDLGWILLCIASALTLWSMIVYLQAAWPDLSKK
ncbi:CDP-diacylglycerol--glycerol-3-phosphate 3-phosphatidyltransferase [Achromatium sp. WMS2]|nr:CDP-diacylglycerol--glycerol-3-phosphate 3-phosphatidyltransferase [Achromatium sp. WMS2]